MNSLSFYTEVKCYWLASLTEERFCHAVKRKSSNDRLGFNQVLEYCTSTRSRLLTTLVLITAPLPSWSAPRDCPTFRRVPCHTSCTITTASFFRTSALYWCSRRAVLLHDSAT